MHRIILPLIAAALASPAIAAERRYTVTDFDRIQIDGPFVVTLMTGKASAVTATAPANAGIDSLSIEVSNRMLRIRPNKSAWGGGYPGERNTGGVRIAVTTRDLRSATMIGSGKLEIDRVRPALRFDAGLSGSGALSIKSVETDEVRITALGAGTMRLGGKAKTVKATVQGSAGLDAGMLLADTLDLNSQTSSNVSFGPVRAVKLRSEGAGDIVIGGKPACTVDNRGSGMVRCGK